MCTTLRLFSLSLLFAVAAGCNTGAEPAGSFAPAPMGEVAQASAASGAWSDVSPADKVDLDWVDAAGTRTRIKFQIVYRARLAQELLAAECVRTHWAIAVERAQRVCEKADFMSEAGIERCERDLQQQMGEALFPCDAASPLATVSKILWQGRLLR